MSKDLLLGRY